MQATLTIEDKKLELPILTGTIGSKVVDISQFNMNNLFTYDPAFLSTASCESKITYIDGNEGILLYRGYPIEQLAEHSEEL
jgi:citrate synthase